MVRRESQVRDNRLIEFGSCTRLSGWRHRRPLWSDAPVDSKAVDRKTDDFLTDRLAQYYCFSEFNGRLACLIGQGDSERSRFVRNEKEVKPLKTNNSAK